MSTETTYKGHRILEVDGSYQTTINGKDIDSVSLDGLCRYIDRIELRSQPIEMPADYLESIGISREDSISLVQKRAPTYDHLVRVVKHRSGFAAVGLVNPKSAVNVGSVLRAAHIFNAAAVMIETRQEEGVSRRIKGKDIDSATNVLNSHRHLPVLRGESLKDMIPYGAVPVAVDLVPGAESLIDFVHPKSAIYVFGAEDATLGKKHLDFCPKRVYVPMPGAGCMNLAAAVNVVLYDRMAKESR